jgi:GxxExxY protein
VASVAPSNSTYSVLPLRSLLVCRRVILELKAVDRFHPIHEAQLLSYLKATGLRLGLLLNFNVTLMKEGIKRLVR